MPKEWNTFFQTCFYLCILMLILTLSIAFINALDLFTNVEAGHSVSGGSANEILYQITGLEGGIAYIWTALLTATGIGAFVVAKLTQSTNMIGIWIFSSVFWTSYTKCFSVININNWIPTNFIFIFTVVFLFLFIGAVIGMLTGSG